MSVMPPTLPTPPATPPPPPVAAPSPPSVPASAHVGGLLLAAAGTALQAIVPYSTGARINWALIVATFLVVYGGAVVLSLFHLQLPSAAQQAWITALTAFLTPLIAHLQTPPAPPTVIVQPAPTRPPASVPPSVSTDAPTAP